MNLKHEKINKTIYGLQNIFNDDMNRRDILSELINFGNLEFALMKANSFCWSLLVDTLLDHSMLLSSNPSPIKCTSYKNTLISKQTFFWLLVIQTKLCFTYKSMVSYYFDKL